MLGRHTPLISQYLNVLCGTRGSKMRPVVYKLAPLQWHCKEEGCASKFIKITHIQRFDRKGAWYDV